MVQSACSGIRRVLSGVSWGWCLVVFGGLVCPADAMDLRGNGEVSVSSGESYGTVYGNLAQGDNAIMADENRVRVTGGTIVDGVYGGNAESSNGWASANGNSVIISGGMSGFDYNIYGGSARSQNGAAEASDNSVSLSGIPDLGIYASVYGGYARESSGDGAVRALGNTVTIGRDISLYMAVGGRAVGESDVTASSSASSNSVSLTGSSVELLYGGYASAEADAEASGNTLSLQDAGAEAIVGGDAYSRQGKAMANANTISLQGGTARSIFGGSVQSDAGTASASNNRIELSGTNVSGSISGGFAPGSIVPTQVDGNTIILDGNTTVAGNVHGGDVTGTTAGSSSNGNSLVVTGGSVVEGDVWGGLLEAAGTVSRNSLLVSNGTVRGSLSGGNAGFGGVSEALGNTITLDAASSVGGSVYGGNVTGTTAGSSSSGNSLVVTGGSVVEGDVLGGLLEAAGTVSHNTILVRNGTVNGSLSGGNAGFGGVSEALGNTIILDAASSVGGSVYGGNLTGTTAGSSSSGNSLVVTGGSVVEGDVLGGLLEAAGTTSHNTILVRNGTVNGSLSGGNAGFGGVAAQNSIIIAGNTQLGSGSGLYGGTLGADTPVAATGSGNTLFIDSWQGSAARVAGFEYIHFVLPAPGVPIEIPMLAVTNAQTGDFDGTTISAQLPAIIDGGLAHVGDVFTLLEDPSGAVAAVKEGELVSLQQGYAVTYDGLLVNTGTAVELRLQSARLNPRVAALNEARAASAGVLNRGGDLVAGTGLDRACAATEGPGGESRWTSFWAMEGGKSRYHTGSWADAEGFSIMAGVARRIPLDRADLFLGAFFEAGVARLDTFNDTTGGEVSGDGDSRYTGGGLLGRVTLEQGVLAGWYVEGAVRAGRIDTSWRSGDLRDNMDRPADYDTDTPYYGGHARLGRLIELGERFEADVYGAGFWTRQEGETVDMNGERVDFEAVDSRRLRLGTRLEYALDESIRPYVGAAWEREFSGTARSVAQDFSIPDASLEGNSGVFELGLAMAPEQSGLDVDVALQWTTGVQDGLGGMLYARYAF